MGAAARLKAVVLCKPAPGPPVAPVAPVGPVMPVGPVLPVGPVFPLEPLGRLPSQLKQLRGYMHVLLSIF
ncbi:MULTISPECIES: hypothetical protein [Bacillus cereus group]|uniref:hypothetical protein n=1 Tax=Bacillus cereus group TaxID=86661 RepID=UPI0012902093|nr:MULTISPECIES: hypothetical protein [Bacillus cereus group]MCC2349521.1 hypothetical protein [Bacillus pacificus]MCU5245257.1 hypothetical protein [Bacillus pacificus]MCU5464075.1 hypothetical protein [Bacillus pacificus]MDA2139954.1 hypothetical protein [Bacillus cereus group sp. Bc256]MDF0737027.1 hypothetical protein [Bacillus pacificus]